MIFCFSGTGNSRYIARRFAEALQEPLTDQTARILHRDASPTQTGRDVILIVPTYAWRIPRVISDWLIKTEFASAERIWFVMDCGSEIGDAAKYNRRLAEQKICSTWELHRLLCRKTTSPCSPHRRQRKPGKSSSRRSRMWKLRLQAFRRDGNFRHLAITWSTAS